MAKLDDELKSKFENERQKAMLNILFTSNWLKAKQIALFKPYGISPQQYNILRILRGARDRMNMRNVKQRMIDRAPNATRLTDKLIQKGLVERERCDEDRRVVYVRITKTGLDLLERVDKNIREQTEQSMRILNDQDAATLNRILDALRG